MSKTNEMPTKATTTTTIHESKQFPFVIVEKTTTQEEHEEKTYFIGLAGQIISENQFDSKDDAEDYIASRPWDLIINLVGTTIKLMQNENK